MYRALVSSLWRLDAYHRFAVLFSVQCAEREFLIFDPAGGQSCEAYMSSYISAAGGYLRDPAATANCAYCQLNSTDDFLGAFGMS